MAGRIILLVTSPRLPAGVLTAQAWDLLRANVVLTAEASALSSAVIAAGAQVRTTDGSDPLGETLAAVTRHGTVVWLAGPGGDEAFARELGLRLAREPGLADLELVYGSWDPPGARLLDVVAVMDRLAGPGGDPWKQQQTHRSLAHYLLEEAYEAYDAIDAEDSDALREELGDVLLQVVLHARMAQDAEHPWTIDDLAGLLVEKLIRRNPHVFGDAATNDIDEIMANWDRIKREEKPRGSVVDGIPLAQPALALAAKVLVRAGRANIAVTLPTPDKPESAASEPVKPEPAASGIASEDDLGEALLALVVLAQARGYDAEAALRRRTLAMIDHIRASPATAPATPVDHVPLGT